MFSFHFAIQQASYSITSPVEHMGTVEICLHLVLADTLTRYCHVIGYQRVKSAYSN